MNIMRMQYEEVDILRGNLEYLKKSRDTNIKALYLTKWILYLIIYIILNIKNNVSKKTTIEFFRRE